MPYGDASGFRIGDVSALARVDWKSALLGGVVVMAVAYGGVLRPAQRQLAALEAHVGALASSVESLNASRDGVTRATTLLERLEEQAGRLAAAEATLERFEVLGDRLLAQATAVEAAEATVERIDGFHRGIAARTDLIDEAHATLAGIDALVAQAAASGAAADEVAGALDTVDAVQAELASGLAALAEARPAAERLVAVAALLAGRSGDSTLAAERLDRLVGVKDRLVRDTADLHVADATLVRLGDLAESLAVASGTVGQLQRFVVDVMLLEPAVVRAVRALEPVIEFTRAGRLVESKDAAPRAVTEREPADGTPATPVTEVARKPADDNR